MGFSVGVSVCGLEGDVGGCSDGEGISVSGSGGFWAERARAWS